MTANHGMMIRHEGRAHIRGKIRRVWRPRYLELTDSGLIRYYELNEQIEQQEHHDYSHPKSTLIIYHARIIDVTTLRDMHVGLPKGTFGFCFHGRRLMFNQSVLVDDAACHPPEHSAPRDFLCAVGTLEQAQSWVVALQWAASIHNNKGDSIDGLWDPVVDYDEDEYYEEKDKDFTRKRRRKNALEVIDTNSLYNEMKPKREKPKESLPTKTSTAVGKIVVTKVRRYRVVCEEKWNRLEIAYDVQILLLRSAKKSKKSTTWMVEERTVVRTRYDLQFLLQQLQEDPTLVGGTIRGTLKAVGDVLVENDLQQSTRKSILLVDTALRKLAMEGAICNSKPMRSFWCITTTQDDRPHSMGFLQRLMGWPLVHDSKALWSKSSLETTMRNPDDLVKQWLQETKTQQIISLLQLWHGCLIWLVKHPQKCLGMAVITLALAYPMLDMYQSIMFSLSLRLDVLIASWIVSFAAGQGWSKPRDDTTARLVIPTSKATTVPTTATPIAAPPREPRFEEEASLLEESVEDSLVDCGHSTTTDEEEEDYNLESPLSPLEAPEKSTLSSPLPQHPANGGVSCWSKPTPNIFRVRGATYLVDRVKVPSAPEPFVCRGVDVWLTDNPERHIARHPSVLGGKLGQEDTFVVNFLLPFGNFVAYFAIPPLKDFPSNLRQVWTKFIKGDQQYRDARLKLLPVVVDGPWIVRKAVGPGTSPALLGKVIPLQYYFSGPTKERKGVYEVDIIITASRIAKGILSVVKGHTNALTIAFAFIIEAAEEEELPETVLCTFQMHALELEKCPQLPERNLDEQ